MATKRLDDEEQTTGNAGGSVITGQGTGGGSQTGTNWTNLSQYLDNNQGAGGQMADDITKDTTKEVNRLEGQDGAVDTWETDAKKKVDSGIRQDTYSGVIKDGTAKDVAGIDQNAYGAWAALGNYTGAKDASQTQGYDQNYKDVNNTKDTIKNLSSYDGQKAALQKSYGGTGGYGKGHQALDAFALNGDKAGQQKLQEFQGQNANFGQKFDKAKTNINTHIGGAEGRGQDVLNRTKTAITDRSAALKQPAQAAFDADDGGYQANIAKVTQAYKDKGLTPNVGIAGVPTGISATRGQANAYMSDDEYAASNTLAGIDGDASTNAADRGVRNSSAINWDELQQYLNPTQPVNQAGKTPILYDSAGRRILNDE